MNILFITEYDPAHHSMGAEQRTKMIYDLLAEKHNVYTLGIAYRSQDEIEEPARNLIWYCVSKRYHINWFLNGILKKIFPAIKIPYLFHINTVVKKHWNGIHFDAVVVRYLNNAAYVTAWEVAPLILDVDDIPSECYRTSLQKLSVAQNILYKIYTCIENRIVKHSQILWVCNTEHKKLFHHQNCFDLPNLPMQNYETAFHFPKSVDVENPFLMTVGYMSHQANYEGVDFFIHRYWIDFHKTHSNFRYKIIGKGVPESIRQKWQMVDGIDVLGFVDSLEDCYSKCVACIVPIYSGSGTCIKTIEAVQHGCFCITTPMGARGIRNDLLTEENGFVVLENDTDFSNAIEKIQQKAFDKNNVEKIQKIALDNWSLSKNRSVVNDSLNCINYAGL